MKNAERMRAELEALRQRRQKMEEQLRQKREAKAKRKAEKSEYRKLKSEYRREKFESTAVGGFLSTVGRGARRMAGSAPVKSAVQKGKGLVSGMLAPQPGRGARRGAGFSMGGFMQPPRKGKKGKGRGYDPFAPSGSI